MFLIWLSISAGISDLMGLPPFAVIVQNPRPSLLWSPQTDIRWPSGMPAYPLNTTQDELAQELGLNPNRCRSVQSDGVWLSHSCLERVVGEQNSVTIRRPLRIKAERGYLLFQASQLRNDI